MAKNTDFAKNRRDQGRALSKAVGDVADLMKTIAGQQGIDLQARLDEVAAEQAEGRRLLAERLQESVLPLFTDGEGRGLDRIGSCVLVRIDSDFYAVTAAHVIREADASRFWAPGEGKGGKLLQLPQCTARFSPSRSRNDLDIAVLALSASELGPFERRVFLTGKEIDQDGQPDDDKLATFYFVLGYSASRTQVTISNPTRHIHQQSFHCATSPVKPAEYAQEDLRQSDHILLDFDHKEILVKGKRSRPPRLQGVSGGGIFSISRTTNQGPLVAIATQNRRDSRLIVGTRTRHFLAMIRELRTKSST